MLTEDRLWPERVAAAAGVDDNRGLAGTELEVLAAREAEAGQRDGSFAPALLDGVHLDGGLHLGERPAVGHVVRRAEVEALRQRVLRREVQLGDRVVREAPRPLAVESA